MLGHDACDAALIPLGGGAATGERAGRFVPRGDISREAF
jgi:hypothetical protein